MFDFERLEVYTHVKKLVTKVLAFLYQKNELDPLLKDHLKKCVTDILFNLAEGTGRMANVDKKHYYTISRSAAFESVAALQVLLDLEQLDPLVYQEFYDDLEVVSKMLLGMIRSFS